MSPQGTVSSGGALEGIHGVHLAPHSPFHVEEGDLCGDYRCSGYDAAGANHHRLLMQRLWQQRPACLRPIKCCLQGDRNYVETFANVLTSLPFIVLGLQAPRVIVGASYYRICLSRALSNQNPRFLMAASALVLPIQPLMVSAVHTGLMEVSFAKRALNEPELRMAHNIHKMSSLLGGALFIADDVFPETPYLHAAWHLAAAVGVSTCNKLLE
ncbi:hypothetical protein Syun_022102 [Stephania yunnanensis]|uniref:Uncharacterized protein n=1 Tax=Stephania yunnanensis TaxID=152371 RepID=A0AAP0IHL9_9MAGN